MNSSIAPLNQRFTHQYVVGLSLWDRIVARIARENSISADDASRIMDQALGFLRLIAMDPRAEYSPSPTVDIGWHAIILYTKDYAALCQSLAGHFIHHVPQDSPSDCSTNSIARTVAAMQVRGLAVDEELWDGTLGECGGKECHTCVR